MPQQQLQPSQWSKKSDFKFSAGPWNLHAGADPFGPTVRPTVPWARKLTLYKELGFDGVQFHDDDAVPDLESKSPSQIESEARAMKKSLDDAGLVCELFAPRTWFLAPLTHSDVERMVHGYMAAYEARPACYQEAAARNIFCMK